MLPFLSRFHAQRNIFLSKLSFWNGFAKFKTHSNQIYWWSGWNDFKGWIRETYDQQRFGRFNIPLSLISNQNIRKSDFVSEWLWIELNLKEDWKRMKFRTNKTSHLMFNECLLLPKHLLSMVLLVGTGFYNYICCQFNVSMEYAFQLTHCVTCSKNIIEAASSYFQTVAFVHNFQLIRLLCFSTFIYKMGTSHHTKRKKIYLARASI